MKRLGGAIDIVYISNWNKCNYKFVIVKIMIFYNYKNKPHSSKKKVSLIPKINIKSIYIYIYI